MNPRHFRIMASRQFALLASFLVAALGVSVLLGWAFNVPALKGVFPGLATMKANNAAAMLLSGAALALLSRRKTSKRIRLLVTALALAVIAVGALTLMEYFFGWQLGIDQALFREAAGAVAIPYPGRMSPSSALCFVFAGTALFVASLRSAWRRWPILSALAASLAALGTMILAAYLFDGLLHFHLWNYTGVAVQTAAGFAFMGTGLLALIHGEGGLTWSIDRSTTRGILIGVASLLMVAMVSNNFTYRLQQDYIWVSHTQEVLKEIEAVAGGVGDLESGQRGYLITGDARLLVGREQTKGVVDDSVESLRSLTSDNPLQQRRLDQLRPLISQFRAWGDRIITARDESGFPAAQKLLASGTGIVLSADLTGLLEKMRDEENRLLDIRRKESEATSTTTFLLLPLGLFLSLTLLSLALFFLNAGVGEQVQAEAVLRQQASLLDLAPVFVRDMDHRIVYWSSGVQKLYSYTKEEALGRISHDVLKTDFGVPLAQIERALEKEGNWEGELVRRARDGSQLVVASQWVLYRDADGKPVRILEVNADITARKRAEALQLRSQKLESLGTLSGGIAHDFNNILLAIKGNTKLAVADLPPDHPVQQSLAAIGKAGSRAADLVRRILAFSRPQELKRELIQLQPVVEEGLELLRATLPATVEIRTVFASGLPAVVADATQIHQIIVNLATNAAHAIGPKSGQIELRLDAVNIREDRAISTPDLQAGRYVHCSVSDNGCGMDRATVDRIFDPFFTTKGPGEGTGLGLSVVHGIIKNHGGAISVYSEPGRGTAFHLYFPASGNAVGSAPESPCEAEPAQNEHVLYVDDDEALVDLVTRVLGRLGYRVSGYTDAARALEKFRSSPQDFDAVVTDLSMPGMSGFEFAGEVLAARPDTPIVMTSGYVRPEDQEEALRMGLRDLILKPDTIEQLGRTLDQVFHHDRTSAKSVPS
ncbi:MAG: CHASE3 domain-containing protein [Candidatus Acidiferrales bacterium]